MGLQMEKCSVSKSFLRLKVKCKTMEKLKKILSSSCPENKDFKCSICSKYLSVAPIFHCNSIGNICGRCDIQNLEAEKKENDVIERQTVFENIGKLLEFPCSHYMKGCKEELCWEGVVTHETSCSFRNAICPLSIKELLEEEQEECSWKGEDDQLMPHIEEEHKKYFSNPLQVCLAPEFKSKLLFNKVSDRELVIIILEYHKSSYKYYFQIYTNLPSFQCNQYTCELVMTDENKTSSIILQKDRVEPMTRGFKVGGEESFLEIDIHLIKDLLKKPAVTVLFSIKKKGFDISSSEMLPISIEQITSPNDQSELMIDELDDELKDKLKCDACNKFLVPPIFSCNIHNICSGCQQPGINNCPVCLGGNLVDNSYTLELITKGLNYPCENKNNGCVYKAPLLKLRCHEEICSFRASRVCLLNCTWQGNSKTFLSHIQEVHGFSEMGRIYSVKLDSTLESMVYFEDQLFYVTLSYKLIEPFQCNVYCIGKEMVEYKYDIVLIGSASMGVKIMLSHLCQPVNSGKIPARFTGISVPFSCLKQFNSNTKDLRFKINISRIKN